MVQQEQQAAVEAAASAQAAADELREQLAEAEAAREAALAQAAAAAEAEAAALRAQLEEAQASRQSLGGEQAALQAQLEALAAAHRQVGGWGAELGLGGGVVVWRECAGGGVTGVCRGSRQGPAPPCSGVLVCRPQSPPCLPPAVTHALPLRPCCHSAAQEVSALGDESLKLMELLEGRQVGAAGAGCAGAG